MDETKALELYKDAAKLGFPGEMLKLAWAYSTDGNLGVVQEGVLEEMTEGDLGSSSNPACYMRGPHRRFWTKKGAMFRLWGAMKRLGPQ